MEPVDAERARQLSLFRPLGASYYTSSVAVRPEHYGELMDRGWRRSGTLYYKQNLQRSCCPHYTLRLEASAFRPRRDQRKAINRWNKFILGPEYMRKVARLSPRSREEKKERKCNFNVLSAVHEVEYSNLKRPIDPATKRAIEPAHRFEVNLEGDSVSQAKFDLFVKYQTKIHREDVSRWKLKDFQNFLCSGIKKTETGEKKLGSWHQCYRLDGKLIAVAVLDLVPSGVSSVYVFYDPEYEQWEFGKLSAMREIAFSIENKYPYYYMGYYIHSCQKMRYKGNYRPQYILDPESNTWDPLDGELTEKLDQRPYVSLSRDRSSGDESMSSSTPLDSDVNEEELSLFALNMPGVLKLDEVKALNLSDWYLLYHGSFVQMSDLVGWEDMPIDNPQSLRGIVSELAAVLGPSIVRNSAVVLFD
ncbi:arginine-tRNA-protein transferase [Penicillium malachiteum]|uniref:arginine-tRNA-protein transferase n=1 Tax=Penicillium malachiteum TaxID=1324776 RepID=UPI0025480627|nr:arginine-tRNA-protein transferase [Penicillium malachiteum]KAJ5720491.1 arginine-tRNA-protein transferase [Penicillium malachiteum]